MIYKIISKTNIILRMMANRERRRRFLLNRFGLRYEPELPNFPPMIMVDITSRCNLACTHCPSSILNQDKDWGGDMDMALYKKIVDETASESPNSIFRPFDGGEPLLRADLEEMIQYAKDKGIKYISINSNGTMLNEKRAISLMQAGLDHIEVSIDAFSDKTYQLLKSSGSYNKVVENVKRINSLRNKIHPSFSISVSFVKQKVNQSECKAFSEFWENRVDRITIREYHQHGGLINDHGKYQEKYFKYRPPCPYLWGRIIIQHDGRVRFCENDWKAEHHIGDLKEQTIKEVWHSEAYWNLRNGHISGHFSHPFCNRCTDWINVR